MNNIPLLFLTDSYKLSHFKAYPKAEKLIAYGEFRTSYLKDPNDSRLIYYGMEYILENYLNKPITQDDLDKLDSFCQTHNVAYTNFPFPRDLFQKVINEHGGWFPIKLESLPEGEVVYPHVPVYQITATGEFSGLITYLESLFTMVWYPSTVATLSRRGKVLISKAFEKSVNPENFYLIESRLHDFGFRGCTSIEQSIIGGSAHLLNFTGSDTIPACYYTQSHLNDGNPVGTSIPASEHSVMTSYPTEREALVKMIDEFGQGIVACVMDSYDYVECLSKILPTVQSLVLQKGGMLVIRPDSGDSIETVIQGLRAAEQVFGTTTNSKGYKVINHCSVIQGDGIDLEILEKLLDKVLEEGFSAENVAFGMGGGLLQKVNRDTLSFATKLSCVVGESGEVRDVMKYPKTDGGKISLPGEFEVRLDDKNKTPLVYPKSESTTANENLLKVVYDYGPVAHQKHKFKEIRDKLETRWNELPCQHNPISEAMEVKKQAWLNSFNKADKQNY